MSAPLRPHLCVIGAGSAGLTATAAARAVGLSVVLVERDRMGGECLNTGCVPSKALIAAARHAEAVRRAAAFGVDAGPPTVDAPRVFAHVHGAIATIAPHDSAERFRALGATVLAGTARFLDPRTLAVGDIRIAPRRVIVATGSRPAVPDLPGLSSVPFLNNEDVFDLSALPASLVVLGGGPVGLELAQAFSRLGVAVTVATSGRALPRDDREAAAIVAARLRREGVDLREETPALAVRAAPGGVEVDTTAGPVRAERLLVATGRRPAVDDLDLAAGGIAATADGIVVDAALRTSNRRVFAIGDVVAGTPRFTHWAGHQAGLAIRTILTRWPHRENRDALPWATYTDPEIAHVGLREAEARARHGDRVRVVRADFSGNDRAVADGDTEGFVRLVLGPRGRVLGADLVGPGAGETAALVALAIAGRIGVGALAGMVAPYPTLAEAVRRAALGAYAEKLADPLVGGLMRLLVRLQGRG
ncbi:dihydrolipoyl dehydrogenase family protein [Oharaeibacter diazotrophicus]|uniref:Pyruvate/2-oxoglutarate dehydrogenase complex dihydrolipoamide dehydrogenase (E3) component n=2 Tax=Oharaeibacter diazotrophicus TaxID=1920512 RepID=A0A4R6RCM6_9HYPH|nr:FAD-dependent oxidoreductase [Oharaeibacter diazotrophicus]TDP83913.1 pyruvate/2-oxoglutarate dehydrogenase complex dihydrolipoamide dehydrogenase (E3) component [Oharaeibacter diazotrophicus]BBE72955.1 mercuric reductase [Pleomorphomonas sp. SM30]GLS74734.1 dihydrolipoamide dehydrogenase [Oharaeibacter diazotrophicus]